MLSLVPSFKLAEQKTELIFLVDRSGSMQGAGIEQARQALKVLHFKNICIIQNRLLNCKFFLKYSQLFLHSLPMDCYVSNSLFNSIKQFVTCNS